MPDRKGGNFIYEVLIQGFPRQDIEAPSLSEAAEEALAKLISDGYDKINRTAFVIDKADPHAVPVAFKVKGTLKLSVKRQLLNLSI